MITLGIDTGLFMQNRAEELKKYKKISKIMKIFLATFIYLIILAVSSQITSVLAQNRSLNADNTDTKQKEEITGEEENSTLHALLTDSLNSDATGDSKRETDLLKATDTPKSDDFGENNSVKQKFIAQKSDLLIPPLEFLGNFTEPERSILSNRVKYILSHYYNLGTDTTADIDRVFSMRVIQNGDIVQFITDFELGGKKIMEEIICQECKLIDLYESINRLIEQSVQHDENISSYDRIRIKQDLSADWEEKKTDLKWHITATSIMVVSYWFSMEEAKKHNDYVNKNKKLKSQLAVATSQSDIIHLNSEISDNEGQINTHKRNYDLFSLVALGGLGWETYLLYKHIFSNETNEKTRNPMLSFNYSPQSQSANISIKLAF